MFGQPSQSSVGMDSQSNVLVEMWKRFDDLEKKKSRVFNIRLFWIRKERKTRKTKTKIYRAD